MKTESTTRVPGRAELDDSLDARRESRLRSRARTQGYAIHKSRARRTHAHDHGGYMIVELNRNTIEAGENFDLGLDDLERFFEDEQ